jgi:C-terminal processing protease CtpA/Prc
MATSLRRHLRDGTYSTLAGEALAQRLTSDLRRISGDGHLRIEYSATPLPTDDQKANAEYDARQGERYYGAHLNFGFEKVERIDGNIGLLDLRVFAPVVMGGATAVAAMQLLAYTDALIIDLRRNGGGDGDMAALLMSYFFVGETKPVSGFFSRPKNETTQRWTQAYVPGLRYSEAKPIYVVISRRTFSAAESFAYDLKALKRAVIVGEPSGGGAHPFEYRRLTAHFVLGLVTGRSVNPITGGNWQGVGVQPDVAVAADTALETAITMARQALGR